MASNFNTSQQAQSVEQEEEDDTDTDTEMTSQGEHGSSQREQANGCHAENTLQDTAKKEQDDKPHEPRFTWIIGKHQQKGKWVFVKEDHYKRALRARILQQMDPRTRFLTHAEQIFGERILQHEHEAVDSMRPHLEVMLKTCAGRFWGLPNDGNTIYHKTQPGTSLPPEIYQSIDLASFCAQYARLRFWLNSLENAPWGHEFYELHSCTVKAVSSAHEFTVSLREIHDASQWPPRFFPKSGTHVHVRKHGRCIFMRANRSPDLMRFYKHVLSAPISEIRSRTIWHIAFAWHFYVHVSTSSESLAECVGSFLQTLRRQNVTCQLSTKRIAWATQLKAAGLRGLGGEEGILSMALNVHFNSQDPSGWHFQSKSANGDRKTKIDIHKEVRLSKQPSWVAALLVDLIRTRKLKVCKQLPRTSTFIVDKANAKEYDKLTPCYKRQRIDALGQEYFEPRTLNQELWKRLGVSVLSLSKNLRPGATPR